MMADVSNLELMKRDDLKFQFVDTEDDEMDGMDELDDDEMDGMDELDEVTDQDEEDDEYY
jgi:hypothetical protein